MEKQLLLIKNLKLGIIQKILIVKVILNLWIYFDENITHLPDHIIESSNYKKYENNIINLNN